MILPKLSYSYLGSLIVFEDIAVLNIIVVRKNNIVYNTMYLTLIRKHNVLHLSNYILVLQFLIVQTNN